MNKKEKTVSERSNSTGPAPATERERAIDLALQQIERRFGKGAIMKLGEASHIHVDVIPTGSIALDLALGVGGVPRGRVTEIYGPEASGKTTLCQHIIANAQRAGGYAAFIDAEHALDRTYAANCGARKSVLCSAILRRPRAVKHSSSTLLCAWIFAVLTRSSRGRMSWAVVRASKWSRIKLLLHSALLSLISCTARGFPVKAD